MLVYGIISPHPPIILPEIGRDQLKFVKKTIEALELAAKNLANSKPDELIIISPHTEHGFYVPLYYLGKHLPRDIKITQILVTNPSYKFYYDEGKKTGKETEKSHSKVAIIASGDLSHCLKKDGPYGFNPAGPKLDKIIVDSVKNNDIKALLNIDPVTLDQGAECGLRSILFLMGAFSDIRDLKTEVLSYEGPFGVGYIVAEFISKRIHSSDHLPK